MLIVDIDADRRESLKQLGIGYEIFRESFHMLSWFLIFFFWFFFGQFYEKKEIYLIYYLRIVDLYRLGGLFGFFVNEVGVS